MLVPTLVHRAGQCLAVPAATAEVAAEIVRRYDGQRSQIWNPSPILHSAAGSVADAANKAGTALDVVSSYFDAIYKTRMEAYRGMAETVDRFKKAGGKLTDADYVDLVAKRRVAQDILQSTNPPVFRFEPVSQRQFQEWARLQAVVASMPPGRARLELERVWRALEDRFVANFPSKSLQATKAWATRLTKVNNRILFVIEFQANVVKLLTAPNTVAANKAAGELAKQAASRVGGEVVGWLASRAVVGLAVTFGLTPLGWVVIGAGFAGGLLGGMYLENLDVPKLKPFLDTTDVRVGLP